MSGFHVHWRLLAGVLLISALALPALRCAKRESAAPSARAAAAQPSSASSPTARSTPVPPPVRAVRKETRAGHRVIFVGLDGADWQLLDRYMAKGWMPNLARLVREGHGGDLETIHPPLSPLVWTTMMTGVSPVVHGILDFTRFNPQSGNKEPITSDERKVPAVWNMATWGGKSVAVFALWATYPAEPVNGLMVSDRLFTFLFAEGNPPPGIVYPKTEEGWARAGLKGVEKAVDYPVLKSYLPWLGRAEYDQDKGIENPYENPVSALRRILVDTDVYKTLALDWLNRHLTDVGIVYFEGTDSIGHIFAPFAPPKQPEVSARDYQRYHQVPELYFRHIDEILGRFIELAEKQDAVLMLASDHGFHWITGRPVQLSSFAAATAAKWHRKEGIYLLWGPGITPRPGHKEHGSVKQVAATLLAIAGLPQGEAMYGPPLPGAPAPGKKLSWRQFYKPRAVPAASSSPEQAAASKQALAKLRALGYIGSEESSRSSERPGKVRSTRTAGSWNNEGLILSDEGEKAKAIEAYDKAISIDPHLASALWNLSDLLFSENRDLDRSDRLLVRAFAAGLPEGRKFLIGRAIGYQRSGDPERSLQLLDQALASRADDPELWLFRGRYRVEERNCEGALSDFERAQTLAPQNPVAFTSAGLAKLCLGDRSGAIGEFRQSLRIKPDQPRVRQFLEQLGG